MRLSDPQKVVLLKLLHDEQPDTAETYSVDALIRRGLVIERRKGGYRLTSDGRVKARRFDAEEE